MATMTKVGSTPYSITYLVECEANDPGVVFNRTISLTASGMNIALGAEAEAGPLRDAIAALSVDPATLGSQADIRTAMFASGNFSYEMFSNWAPPQQCAIEGVYSDGYPRLTVMSPDRTALDALNIYFTVRLRHSIGR